MRRLRLLLVLVGPLAACEFPAYEIDVVPSGGSGQGGAPAPEPKPEPKPDPCAALPCLHDGRCIPFESSFVCLCAPGLRGDVCEIDFDDCDPDPCQNGGLCVDGEDASRCDCVEGWEGATCQVSVDDCASAPCQNGGVCVDGFKSHQCNCQPGFVGDECRTSLPPTCLAILQADAAAKSGIYTVDPDGPGLGNPPLEVLCDMTSMDGGWTMVAQEREGDTGTLKFLGISVGDPSRAARSGDSALVGEQFRGLYDEMRIGWSNHTEGDGAMYFRVNEEVFVNNVRKAMPVSKFGTTDARLSGWVSDAGGAVFCRGSESPGVRPGDSSWAIKPKNDKEEGCGCSSPGWYGRGAYYSGQQNATTCTSSGGGWAGISGDDEAKGNIDKWGLQIWVR